MSKKAKAFSARTAWNNKTVSAKSRKAIAAAARHANITTRQWLDDQVAKWIEGPCGPAFDAGTLQIILKFTDNAAKGLAARRDKERSLGRNEIANMYRDQCEGIEAIRSLISGLAQIDGIDNSEITPPQNVEPTPPLP